MNAEDPFLQVQSDVLSLLTSTRPLLSSYNRIKSTTSPSNPELRDTRAELLTALEDLEADLEDLRASVRAVEGDPYKYGLELEEIERRRKLVKDVGREVIGMMKAVQVGGDTKETHGGAGLPDPGAFDSDEDHGPEDDDAFAAMEEQRQQEMMEEQDQALDGVFRTVGNLRQQADDMGRELEEQGDLLDSVDVLADRMGGKLQNGIKKIGWVIQKNEGMWAYGHVHGALVVNREQTRCRVSA